VSEEESDLGMIMQKSTKPSMQCAEASRRLVNSRRTRYKDILRLHIVH